MNRPSTSGDDLVPLDVDQLALDAQLAPVALGAAAAAGQLAVQRRRPLVADRQLAGERRLLQDAEHEAEDVVEQAGDDAAVGSTRRSLVGRAERQQAFDLVATAMHLEVEAPRATTPGERAVVVARDDPLRQRFGPRLAAERVRRSLAWRRRRRAGESGRRASSATSSSSSVSAS